MFNYFNIYYDQYKKLPKGSYSTLSVILNYLPWRGSMKAGRSALSDHLPWMTFDAIHFLKKNVRKDMRVFEYGSGGSSVFFSKLAKEVVSAEHDKDWLTAVKKVMDEYGISNWQGILCEPERIESGVAREKSNADDYSTGDEAIRSFSFKNYVKTIDKFPDHYFDLIVIDGRSRPSCLKHSVSKLKKNGLIILDNSDRTYYQQAISNYITDDFIDELSLFGPTIYSPDFTQTMIRRKIT